MKKLTAGIFATLLAVVSVGAAHAEIASKGYVDQQVGEVESTVSTINTTVTELGDTINNAETGLNKQVEDLGTRVGTAEGEIDTLQTEVAGKQAALGFTPENSANKTTTLSGTSTDAQYPSAKAVWDTIQTETSDIASTDDLSALTTRVGTLETASKTHATKTELTDGLAEKLDTTTAATTYATKTELAGKQNTIAGAQLEALNSGITADKVEAYDGYAAQISGKLDTATADGKYAAKSTEGVADTASTNAQTALTNIGTLTDLTTDAKTNTVAAINEVAEEAAAAASAASAADTKAGQAQTTANAALPKATYNSEVGTVSATNMGTTASTVVTAINEVAGEAAAAQQKANAAIPKPDGECSNPTNKCVLVSNGTNSFEWEVIARDGKGK